MENLHNRSSYFSAKGIFFKFAVAGSCLKWLKFKVLALYLLQEKMFFLQNGEIRQQTTMLRHHSLGLLWAPKAPSPRRRQKAKCMWSPLSVFIFFQAKRRVGIKRRATSFGVVVGMDENSIRFLADGDPTIGSGITGHQSSEFPSQKKTFSRLA